MAQPVSQQVIDKAIADLFQVPGIRCAHVSAFIFRMRRTRMKYIDEGEDKNSGERDTFLVDKEVREDGEPEGEFDPTAPLSKLKHQPGVKQLNLRAMMNDFEIEGVAEKARMILRPVIDYLSIDELATQTERHWAREREEFVRELTHSLEPDVYHVFIERFKQVAKSPMLKKRTFKLYFKRAEEVLSDQSSDFMPGLHDHLMFLSVSDFEAARATYLATDRSAFLKDVASQLNSLQYATFFSQIQKLQRRLHRPPSSSSSSSPSSSSPSSASSSLSTPVSSSSSTHPSATTTTTTTTASDSVDPRQVAAEADAALVEALQAAKKSLDNDQSAATTLPSGSFNVGEVEEEENSDTDALERKALRETKRLFDSQDAQALVPRLREHLSNLTDQDLLEAWQKRSEVPLPLSLSPDSEHAGTLATLLSEQLEHLDMEQKVAARREEQRQLSMDPETKLSEEKVLEMRQFQSDLITSLDHEQFAAFIEKLRTFSPSSSMEYCNTFATQLVNNFLPPLARELFSHSLREFLPRMDPDQLVKDRQSNVSTGIHQYTCAVLKDMTLAEEDDPVGFGEEEELMLQNPLLDKSPLQILSQYSVRSQPNEAREEMEQLQKTSKKIYVENLPPHLSAHELIRAFAPCGKVVAVEIFKDRLRKSVLESLDKKKRKKRKYYKQEGKSPVYGFVYFGTNMGKQRALAAPMQLFGVVIQKSACPTQDTVSKRTLVIGNLPSLHIDEVRFYLNEMVFNKLPSNGRLVSLSPDSAITLRRRNFVVAEFDSHEAAQSAYWILQGSPINGKNMRVGWGNLVRRVFTTPNARV